MSTVNPPSALRHLRKSDPVMARVIADVGPCKFTLRTEGTHFDAVVRSIVFQQLSGKAAGTIHRRLIEFYDMQPGPTELLATNDDALRGVGLSRQKVGYLKDLAMRCMTGEVPIDRLHELDDPQVIDALVRVKGVGTWTAQMFLMFRLGRPDVLPVLDLGIQTAIQRAYALRKRPLPKQVEKMGAKWRPHATIASWYLWRSLDNEGGAA